MRVVTLVNTADLTVLKLREGGTFTAHDHGRATAKKSNHNHSHGSNPGAGANSTSAEIDGHVWLDPQNAKLIAMTIATELGALAPTHADTFRRNATALSQSLDQLDGDLSATLKPVGAKPFIVFHDAYQYFERRYGLTPAGSVTVNPDVPPSAKRLSELRRKTSDLKAVCIFAEPQFAPRVIDTIAEGTQMRRGVLDPLGASVPAGPDLYFSLMKGLADSIRACLADPS